MQNRAADDWAASPPNSRGLVFLKELAQIRKEEKEKRRRRLENINTLKGMGYSTHAAKQALHQARGNLDDALKVVLLGFSEQLAAACRLTACAQLLCALAFLSLGTDGLGRLLVLLSSSRARVMALGTWPGASVAVLPNSKGV